MAMMQAMGGEEAWRNARYVRYDFQVNIGGKQMADRAHLWDKQTGRYRLEGKNKQGQKTLALFHAGTQQGSTYVEGKKLEGAPAAAALKEAYGSYINDMYWLAMPWKWMDAGVNLKYLGRKPLGAKSYDVVELTFGKVGLTPGDRYHAYVSPSSKLMEHWDYMLQSGQKGSWDWEYTETGGIKLASNHTSEKNSINMGQVKVTAEMDAAHFTDQAKMLR